MPLPTLEAGVPQSIYTITNIKVAQWTGAAYEAPISLTEGQNLQFEPQADTDQKKSYGGIKRLLTVFTHVNFTIGVGLIQPDAFWHMTGVSISLQGTTGEATAVQRLGFQTGGAGLPYFGVVGTFASDDGGDVVIGIPLCKLDSLPSLSSDQNKFILPDSSGSGIANIKSSTPNQGLFIDLRKTAADITDFGTFFGIA